MTHRTPAKAARAPAAPAAPCSTTRRSFVRAVVSAPLAAVPALASADDELIGFVDQMMALMPGYQAAVADEERLNEEYFRRKPAKPRTLLWRLGDPVGYSRGEMHVENGKRYLWCDLDNIEKLRGREHCMHLPKDGVEAEDGHRGDDGAPLSQYAHLYDKWPVRWRQKRADELLKAADEWSAECRRLKDELGLDVAAERTDAIADRIYAINNRINELPAHTIEGLRAKAQALVEWNWDGAMPSDDENRGAPKILFGIVRDLIGGAEGAKGDAFFGGTDAF